MSETGDGLKAELAEIEARSQETRAWLDSAPDGRWVIRFAIAGMAVAWFAILWELPAWVYFVPLALQVPGTIWVIRDVFFWLRKPDV